MCLVLLVTGCAADDEILQPIETVGEVPSELQNVVKGDLFRDIYAFGDRVLKVETSEKAGEENMRSHRIVMMDRYGKELASYQLESEYTYSVDTLTATSDGGFLFVLGFRDRGQGDGTWASERGFASRVVKCDSNGSVLFDTPFDALEGSALSVCLEKDGSFYFFGHRQTPETDQVGVHSRTDVVMYCLDGTGKLVKSGILSGSDYDDCHAAELTDSGFLVSISSQSSDGDFEGSDSGGHPADWVVTLDFDFAITKKAQKSGRDSFDSVIGMRGSEPIYQSDIVDSGFDAGEPFALIEYGTFDLIVSTHKTGIYENTPPVYSSIWYYTETVYSGYDSKGKLLFRASVDSSPDYDAMAEILVMP